MLLLQRLQDVLGRREAAREAEIRRLSAQLAACREENERLKAQRWQLFQQVAAQTDEGRLLLGSLAGQDCEVTALMCHNADLAEQLCSLGIQPRPPRFPLTRGWAKGAASAVMLDLSG